LACSLALARAGIRIDISRAMMEITTNNSINVKPFLFFMEILLETHRTFQAYRRKPSPALGTIGKLY
jgi:hypothetical protein